MAVIETWFDQDLKEPVKVRFLNGNVFSQDNQGNLIGVNLFDNGSPATLSGSVSGSAIRADGATVALTGTLSGNRCSVKLPQSAYAVPGIMSVIIKLTSSGVITTVCAVTAVCYRSSTDTIVDPGTIIPSIQTLIGEIDDAIASIPADYSSLWASLAPPFSTSKVYSAGAYVTNDGGLYKFVKDHSGTWDDDDVYEIPIGNEVSSAIANIEHRTENLSDNPAFDYISRKGVWSLNRINDSTGADLNNGNLTRTDNYIEISTKAIAYHIKPNTQGLAVAIYFYDSSKTFLGYTDTGYYTADRVGQLYDVPSNAKYARLSIFRQTGGSKFTSLNDALDYVDIYQYKNNMDVADMGFFIGETCSCSVDGGGHPINFKTEDNSLRAISKYYPVGKGTTIKVRQIDGATYTDLYAENLIYVYTFDDDFNVTGFMNPDAYANEWVAPSDCYIRLCVRYSKTLDMTDAYLAASLDRVSVYYVPPKDTRYALLKTTESKPAKTSLVPKVALYSITDTYNEAEFSSNTRVITPFFPVGKGTLIRMDTTKGQNSDLATKLDVKQYDKNFTLLSESYAWEVDEVIHQDGYARCSLRRDNTNTVGSSDVDFLYNCLSVELVQPQDADLLAPLDVSMARAVEETTGIIYNDRINEACIDYTGLSESGRLGYAWISDIHTTSTDYRYSFNKIISKREMTAVKRAAEKYGVDFIVVGGDIYDKSDVSKDEAFRLIADTLEPLGDSSVPVIVLFGNHDNNVLSATAAYKLTWDEAMGAVPQRSKFYNSIQFADVSKGYFYFDIPSKRKRVICFNGSDPEGGGTTFNWWTINQAQVEWFCETASDTGYDIVILTHTPPGTQYGYEGNGDSGGYYTDLASAIEAYNDGDASITLYGRELTFRDRDERGEVKYIHCGHTHFDLDPTVEPFTWGGVPVVTTSCAKAWAQYVGSNEATEVTPGSDLYYYTEAQAQAAHANTYGWKFYLWTNRKFGTINECIADIVSVNSDKVHTFRIGAGNDREYTI